MAFPYELWTRIRTNYVIERLNRDIRRRTRVVGSFPDGKSALMLACARLRHVAGTQWGKQEIHEHETFGGVVYRLLRCRLTSFFQSTFSFCDKSLTLPIVLQIKKETI